MKNDGSIIYDETPKKKKKGLIILIVLVATIFTVLPLIFMVYAIFNFENSVYTEFEESESGEVLLKKDTKIYEVEGFYNESDKTYYIQGYLENLTKEEIGYVTIEYLVYDDEDALLGTAYASIDSLKGNSRWKFKAIYFDIDSNEVSRFELSKVEMY